MKKPGRFFTVALAVEGISPALELLVAFAAYLQSKHQFYSCLQGTTKTMEPLSTASAMDVESKVTSCDKLHGAEIRTFCAPNRNLSVLLSLQHSVQHTQASLQNQQFASSSLCRESLVKKQSM